MMKLGSSKSLIFGKKTISINIEIVLTRTEPQMEELKATVDVNRSSACNGIDILKIINILVKNVSVFMLPTLNMPYEWHMVERNTFHHHNFTHINSNSNFKP